MDSLAAISGLATGIDFREMVDQIIELEDARLDYLRVQISDDQAEKAAWQEVRDLIAALEEAGETLSDGSGLDVFNTEVFGVNPGILAVTANENAAPGRHSVRILQSAQREVLGSTLQSSSVNPLGVSGSFILGGTVVEVVASDTLQSIAARINEQNFGPNPIGATATVVGSDGAYRLILSATDTGEEGLGLRDIDGVLTSLGFLGSTTELSNRTSGGFASDGFADTTTAVASLLGVSTGAPAGVVTLGSGAGAFTVSLDLGTQSLEDVRDAINSAASAAGSAMFAAVEAAPGGGYRLAVTGTAAATDANGVLQALGVVQASRTAVAQVLQGDVLTTDAGGTLATASTALTSLYNGGSPAGAAVGDTLVFQGRDDSGGTFSFTHTIQAGDTLQTLMTRLEGAEGFNGSATVEIDVDGRLAVTSATPGASLLELDIFAGNEGGGILDLGDPVVTTEGRDLQISEGRDALVEIDGALVQSASNDIDDVVSGLTFSVLGADPSSPLEVVVTRNAEAGVEAIQAYVDALNAFVAFVDRGSGVTGENRPPLAGNTTLRGILSRINFAMQSTVPVGTNGSLRLADIGIEVTREGTYTLDTSELTSALQDDPESVRRAFGAFGSTNAASLLYVGAGSGTAPGTYAVDVTQAATRAEVTSAGFGGVYVDDATADLITITDAGSSAQYQVALVNGQTLSEIVDALNTEFAQQTAQEVTSQRTMYSDSGATTVANASTALGDLYHGAGQSSGYVAGSEITISGTDPNGNAVLDTFTVTDPATQTLGDLRAAVQSAFGSGVSASIVNGQLVVTDQNAGASQLSVTIGSDVPGNAAPFGIMQVTATGRDNAGLVAEDAGGELRIRAASYGSAGSFSVALSAGGGDGTASLGLGTGAFSGTDVAGTIGGEAATGVGNTLTADAGTTAAGLAVQVSAGQSGALGEVTYGRGIMASVVDIAEQLLGSDDGSIDEIVKRLDQNVERIEDRLFEREERLEDRREALLQQFIALEQAIARAQSQQQWIQSQIASLPTVSSGSDS